MKDYEFGLSFHPDKGNVVADALSIKQLHMFMLMVQELELIEQFRDMSLVCEENPNSVKFGMLKLNSDILEEIKEGQNIDVGLVDRLVLTNQGKICDFRIDENSMMRFRDMRLVCEENLNIVKLGMLKLASGILEEIREVQKTDVGLVD